jgi:hypothetical protein
MHFYNLETTPTKFDIKHMLKQAQYIQDREVGKSIAIAKRISHGIMHHPDHPSHIEGDHIHQIMGLNDSRTIHMRESLDEYKVRQKFL